MRVCLLTLAAALSTALAAPAHAVDTPGMAPHTPWTLDYDNDSCALRRLFGEGDNQGYIEFRRFRPGQSLQAVVASNRLKLGTPTQFKYRFGEDDGWREPRIANAVVLADGFSGVIFDPSFLNLPEMEQTDDPAEREAYLKSVDWQAVERESAAKIDTITVRGAFHKDLTLRLGSLDKPIAALNKCIDELITHWGIDVEAHKSLTRQAVPINLGEVTRMIDYPPMMVAKRMPGLVNLRLEVDEGGQVTACHIQMPLSDPAFEKSSCSEMQHELAFDPALDKDGKPIASYWTTRVNFLVSDF